MEILTTLTTLVVMAIAIKFLMRVMWQTVQRYISKEGAGWSNVETTQNQTKPYYIVLLLLDIIIITEKLSISFQVKEAHISEICLFNS